MPAASMARPQRTRSASNSSDQRGELELGDGGVGQLAQGGDVGVGPRRGARDRTRTARRSPGRRARSAGRRGRRRPARSSPAAGRGPGRRSGRRGRRADRCPAAVTVHSDSSSGPSRADRAGRQAGAGRDELDVGEQRDLAGRRAEQPGRRARRGGRGRRRRRRGRSRRASPSRSRSRRSSSAERSPGAGVRRPSGLRCRPPKPFCPVPTGEMRRRPACSESRRRASYVTAGRLRATNLTQITGRRRRREPVREQGRRG